MIIRVDELINAAMISALLKPKVLCTVCFFLLLSKLADYLIIKEITSDKLCTASEIKAKIQEINTPIT